MTKKDTFILLSPAIFFLLIAIASLLTANMIRSSTSDDDSQRKFESFVENVKSGKWQLTTQMWLEGMHDQRDLVNAYRSASVRFARAFEVLMFTALFGIFIHLAVVFSFLRKMNIRQNGD